MLHIVVAAVVVAGHGLELQADHHTAAAAVLPASHLVLTSLLETAACHMDSPTSVCFLLDVVVIVGAPSHS